MPYIRINTVLREPLTPNSTLEVPYPEGKNEGSFFGSSEHTLTIETNFFRSPKDFVVVPTRERIVIHWLTNIEVPSGAICYLHLQEQGGDFYTDPSTGHTIKGMVKADTFMINLGAVKSTDPEYYISDTKINEPGRLILERRRPDTVRNITVTSNKNESSTMFRIEGEDIYLNPIVEHIQGPNKGTVEGKKSFLKVTKVSTNEACNGIISVGIGDCIGLPVFIPSPGYLIRELINGLEVTGGIITPGEVIFPKASTGDRRGTYKPPQDTDLSQNKSIQLFVMLPNPGNIGSPDYSGS